VFQGQAARAVWLLELLWFPLGMVTVGRLWGAGPGTRAAAVALLAVMLAGPNLAHPLAARVLAGAVAVGVVVARVSGAADWTWRGLAAALVLWGAAWYTVLATVHLTTDLRPGSFFAPSLTDRVDALHAGYGPLPRLAACLAVLTAAGVTRRPRAWGAVAVVTWMAASAAAYLLPRTEWAASRDAPRAADVRLAQDVIAGSWDGSGPPTVYWPGGRMDTVWYDLGGNSYFTYWQLSSNIFFRGNAVEGARRWLLTAPFEADPDRPGYGSAPRPTADQLRALVADPVVDYVVLPYDFGGWAGTNGSVWVYDARRLRRTNPAHVTLPP
jgi:hypothetical protein